jgi:hypothetical protein
MSYEDFGREVDAAIAELSQTKAKEIFLVHHDDADGICSAAVTETALEREGCRVKTLCLEKVYPEVIERLHEAEGEVIFYCDIGSSHADLISECNISRNLVVILDHHDPKPATDPKVYDLNLEHYGFRGETDFTGATCCYLFARALNERNVDLSYLALVGSCEIPGDPAGLNKVVLDESVKNGVVHVEGKKVEIVKLGISIDKLFSSLQILGSVGYYEGGPELGIQACLQGINDNVKRKINDWEERRKQANKKLLGTLYRERLKETDHIQWFDAGDTYKGMGAKVVGTFCSFLAFQKRLVKADKYIFGFTEMAPEVPSYGELKENYVKVSVRVPEEMKKLIDAGKMPSTVDLLLKASDGFGIADGHAYAANCVLPTHMKYALIENAEKAIRDIKVKASS